MINEELYNEIIESWSSSMKKTKPRIFVLAILKQSDKMLSAQEIHELLIKSGEKANLSTVYRILDVFVEEGLLIKNHYTDEPVSYFEILDEENKDINTAVCLSCKVRSPLESGLVNDEKIENNGFTVKSHRVEVYGYCSDCSDKN